MARRRLVGAKTPWKRVRLAYVGGIRGTSFSSSSTTVAGHHPRGGRQREAPDERRQRRPPRIAGKEHRLRGGRRRIQRLEEAVDLAPALVVVEESVQLRHHPSTGAHHDATNIVIVGGIVGANRFGCGPPLSACAMGRALRSLGGGGTL